MVGPRRDYKPGDRIFKNTDPDCPDSPGIDYTKSGQFKRPEGVPYLLEGGKTCGGCANFHLCSRVGDKNAKTWQNYCAAPEPFRGYKPEEAECKTTLKKSKT